jgi:GNAT superfamily N-acetyltransferase
MVAGVIRQATPDDIPEIARLGKEFHAQAQWADVFDYSIEDCAASLATFMASGAFICLVAEETGIVGMAAGLVSPVYFNHAHLSGEELFWWVDPTRASQGVGLRLLTALEDAAKARGCQSWQMKSIDRLNGERMAKLYARRGYRASEHTFIKRL